MARLPPVLAGALAGAGLIAIASLVPEIRAQGWWEDGLHRLAVDAVCRRFDVLAGVAAGTVLAVSGVLHLWRRGGTRARPRRVSRLALAVLALLALLRLGVVADWWRAGRGPNLVLISVDTLRADHLSAYGNPLPTSPTLDARLVAEGVTFEQVLSQSPKTTPSHMTMLTSLYPCVHGVTMWETADEAGAVLNPRVHTLAEILRNAGYATAAFTAGGPMDRSRGFDAGFDVYKHSQQLKRASAWLEKHRRRKLFLFFHTYDVHDPYTPPPELAARFDGDYQGPLLEAVRRIRAGVGDWERAHEVFWKAVDRSDPRSVHHVERLYDAGIRNMDEHTLAPLLDRLDALGLAGDTLVVFTSDHGEAFGEHGAFLHDDLYLGTLHVPLVLRFPGRLPAGRRVETPARLLDLTPTVLDLLGVAPPPAQLQGQSLAGPARGTEAQPPLLMASEHGHEPLTPTATALRAESRTLLRTGEREQLFDLQQDPGEHHDRLAEEPAAAATLRAQLADWRAECQRLHARYGPSGQRVAPSPETVQQLRALGYVE